RSRNRTVVQARARREPAEHRAKAERRAPAARRRAATRAAAARAERAPARAVSRLGGRLPAPAAKGLVGRRRAPAGRGARRPRGLREKPALPVRAAAERQRTLGARTPAWSATPTANAWR